jgi:hypothetical protein
MAKSPMENGKPEKARSMLANLRWMLTRQCHNDLLSGGMRARREMSALKYLTFYFVFISPKKIEDATEQILNDHNNVIIYCK